MNFTSNINNSLLFCQIFSQVQHPLPGSHSSRCQPVLLCSAPFVWPADPGNRPPSPAGGLEHCMAFGDRPPTWKAAGRLHRYYWVRTLMFLSKKDRQSRLTNVSVSRDWRCASFIEGKRLSICIYLFIYSIFIYLLRVMFLQECLHCFLMIV